MRGVFRQLGLTVLERGWLSSNNVVFEADSDGAAVVDTGYDTHASQTVALLGAHLGNVPVARVVNTHLHSDHCGGNHAVQSRWGSVGWVPERSIDAVRCWDESRLTFKATGQNCRRFEAGRGLAVGAQIVLAGHAWEIIAAPGHDPDAVMLFQRDSRVLISADALWETRLAIIFPELAGVDGFTAASAALDAIAALEPLIVIPGHGAPFIGVDAALAQSRGRLARFEADPRGHRRHAERALTMFHMLEKQRTTTEQLVGWLQQLSIFGERIQRSGARSCRRVGRAGPIARRRQRNHLVE